MRMHTNTEVELLHKLATQVTPASTCRSQNPQNRTCVHVCLEAGLKCNTWEGYMYRKVVYKQVHGGIQRINVGPQNITLNKGIYYIHGE